ncbi:Multidrug resistance protein 1 [Actinomortierella wolfii]|nr:Multidrug resistance protein 1 [Actinomortierella wolfii]
MDKKPVNNDATEERSSDLPVEPEKAMKDGQDAMVAGTVTEDNNKKKETATEKKTVPFWQLFRFASKKDWIFISSLVVGIGQPVFAALNFGNIVDQVHNPTYGNSQSEAIIHAALLFFLSGLGIMTAAYFQTCLWTIAAENQVRRIREKYLHAILRQDIGWHDAGKNKGESFTTRLSGDAEMIYDGIADKCGMTVSSFATFIAGFVVSFARAWKLSLVVLALVPFLAFTGAFMAIIIRKSSTKSLTAYSRAGAIAEQAISSIRTVVSFGGQQREMRKYAKNLDEAYAAGFRKAFATGSGNASFVLILFSAYALAFWYGSVLIERGEMSPGQVMSVFFAMIIAAYALGRVGPNLGSFAAAQGAAYNIFQTIDRVPVIDTANPGGAKPTNIQGHIEIKDVDFTYPARSDVQILFKMNLEVMPGETIALVGQSGSGKSTIVGLVERFYDPQSGSVTLDGIDLKEYNVTFLRDTIGIVSQEPVLFNASIKHNIAMGIRKDQSPPTDKEIEDVCKLANAHDFIMKLPKKYDTLVGEKGALLSGGQKQRIAIARALIKNPKILLLDEATSALDTESERIVQDALDKAAAGRSTIIVAHRLSTIMNANRIYVMEKGVVKETGTHKSLLAHGGIYADLVAKQQLRAASGDNETSSTNSSSTAADGDHTSTDPDQIVFAEDTLKNVSVPNGSEALRGRRHSVVSAKTKKSLDMAERRADMTIGIEDDAVELESEAERKKREKMEALKRQPAPLLRVAKAMKPEMGLAIFGAIMAGVSGANWPIFSRIFAQIIGTITNPESPTFRQDANFWSLMFFVLGLVTFVASFVSVSIFELIGERMSRRMRLLGFSCILGQEMAFFDDEAHTTGALTSRLATDAFQMHDLVGLILRTSCSTAAVLTIGLIFAFEASWRLTLITMICIPVLVTQQYFAVALLTGFSQKTQKAYEHSGRVAAEAIGNIRTIAALAKEAEFEAKYRAVTVEPHKYAFKKAVFGSIGVAMSQSLGYWCYALGFFASAHLERKGLITYEAMFQVMFAIVYMALGLGELSQYMPKYIKGKQSAINIFELLDKKTTIDADKDGIRISQFEGSAALEKVDFAYPTRPTIQIFKGVDLQVLPSQTVALVGPSGCGKSTIIALLERWYDALGGKVIVDNYNIKDLQLNNLREHMALVGQEPVLFDVSIGDNIRYGVPDDQAVDHEQVVAAARAANIHDFVMSLPKGYDTPVGDKGSQLSGGQKQRIAIARALIRNPRILLLDEATSALDSESEKLVQEALDKARKGRTTIVIAHRLSTIQDADLILVVKDGSIVEFGRHNDLMGLGGVYAQLCKKQNLEVTH